MTKLEQITAAWLPIAEEFNATAPMRAMASGEFTLDHYKGLLRQIFHHTRENPQIQALATVHFRGSQRNLVKRFFQHATSEIGHDQLALDDLVVLGEDVSRIPFERPLPATTALLGYAFYQIEHLNPVGYLGYLFHLEFLPTRYGAGYMSLLESIGVPRQAMTFLRDHSTIDVGHNKLMATYLEELIRTDEDFDAVVYAMQTTAQLYARMIEAAMSWADEPRELALSGEELRFSDSRIAV